MLSVAKWFPKSTRAHMPSFNPTLENKRSRIHRTFSKRSDCDRVHIKSVFILDLPYTTSPINERQWIDHHKPSCLISVQIFIITREGCLFRTVHAIVWMSHWGGKGLATEGTRTTLTGTVFNPVCCTPHSIACVRIMSFFCVCVCVSDFFLNSSTILENRWILRCGTSERPCPKPQTQWGRTLQTSPQSKNTHIRSFSFPAFKPRSSSKARVSDASVQSDLNYESVYLFCYSPFFFFFTPAELAGCFRRIINKVEDAGNTVWWLKEASQTYKLLIDLYTTNCKI